MKMNRLCQKAAAGAVLLSVILLALAASPAQAQQGDPHGFVIQVRGNSHTFTGMNREYISLEELGPFFGVSVRSVDGGRAAMVGHLYYNEDVRPFQGKAFGKASTFFSFFDVSHSKVNDWTYRLTMTGIPMFTPTLWRFEPKGSVSLQGGSVPMPLIIIKDQKYIDLETFLNAVLASRTKEGEGRVGVNGKRVKHWVQKDGRIYVWVKDASSVTGKSVN
jgi:hypothetical protein